MHTHYDEEVLGEAAERLYFCARVAKLIWTIVAALFLLTGLFASLNALTEDYGPYARGLAGLPLAAGWFSGLIAFAIGNAAAFFFRLRAQIVLATVQTERNTRRDAMLSELPATALAKLAKVTAADLPPYPQPAQTRTIPLRELFVIRGNEAKFWVLTGVLSLLFAAIGFVTGSDLFGLIFGIGAAGALFWYLQLREQGVADPLAVMRERTSTVVGNATDAVRTQAQTLATPREQPPAPPPPPAAAVPADPASIFCSSCGTQLPADASFCGECGTKVA